MSVNGGRSGWARVVAFAGSAGVFGLVSTAGCGSRTSMLDPDVYGLGSENIGNGGSSNVDSKPTGGAGKPTNGSGLLGSGGASPSGGKGGTSGVDPSLSIKPCQQYCPGYGTQCAQRLQGKECLPNCQNELNGSGSVCQVLGAQALNCLTPFFSANGGACDLAVNRALTACSGFVTAFEDCKKGGTSGPKQPPPRVDVTACASMGSVGGPSSTDCKSWFSCSNGTYATYCTASRPGVSDCVCVSPDGTQTSTSLRQSPDVCFEAAYACQ